MKGEQAGICPICGERTHANFVDIGVGMKQIEPYHCTACKWSEPCQYVDDCPGEKCASFSYCRHAPIKSKVQRLKSTQSKITKNLFGMTTQEAKEKRICIVCKKPIVSLRDEESLKEYSISGLCQECQDEMWPPSD